MMNNLYDPVKKVLITEEEIKNKVSELAKKITEDYAGKEIMLVSVLTGSFMFVADLMREIKVPTEISFLFASSYGNGVVSTGTVEIHAGKGFEPKDKEIIIIEDIIDSGRTLDKIRKYLISEGAKSVEICAFLDKPSRRVVEVETKYVGFEVPDEFVIGYGLDFDYKFRQFPFVGVLKEEYYE